MKSRSLKNYVDEEGMLRARFVLGGVSRQTVWNMLKRDVRVVEVDGGYSVWESKMINSGKLEAMEGIA